jgi:hypothetical protein
METEKKTKAIKFVSHYSSKILFLIDNQDDLTRGDLQGTLDAVILQLIHDVQSGVLD